MKLSHFLRYYQDMYGIALPPEEAEDEAAGLGIIIDRTGEAATEAKRPASGRCWRRVHKGEDTNSVCDLAYTHPEPESRLQPFIPPAFADLFRNSDTKTGFVTV